VTSNSFAWNFLTSQFANSSLGDPMQYIDRECFCELLPLTFEVRW